jgi:hypothetical protein
LDEDQVINRAIARNSEGKAIVPAVSIQTRATATNYEPAHVAQVLGSADNEIRTVYDMLRNHVGPIFPKDLNKILETDEGRVAYHAFESVLSDSFEPKVAPRFYREVFNVSEITLLNEAMRSLTIGARMLVVEPRKNDVKRIQCAIRESGKAGQAEVFLQTPVQVRGQEQYVPGVKFIYQTLDFMAAKADSKGEFDAIFFPYNLAQKLGECTNRFSFMSKIKSMLRPGGRIYGLYLDHESVREMANAAITDGVNDITIYSEFPDRAQEGTYLTKIADNKVFEDYVLTMEGLQKLAQPGDNIDVLPAREYFKRATIPKFLQDASRHVHQSMIRIVRWSTIPRRVWIKRVDDTGFHPTGSTADTLIGYDQIYNVNRGVAFSDEDLFYHIPERLIVTPKADGQEAVLWSDSSGAVSMLKRGDPLVYMAEWTLPPDIILQVEMIGDDPTKPRWIVLTDVILWPGSGPGYESRMDMARREFSCHNSPITMPDYLPGSKHIHFDRLNPPYPFDGYVLNDKEALPGMFAKGRGAARYLKHFYTKEIDDDGQIYEVPLEGERIGFPKLRRDRNRATTASELRALKAAWTVEDYDIRMRVLGVPPISLSRFLTDPPRDEFPHYVFSIAELVYLWTPWRDRSVETGIFKTYGHAGVDMFHRSLSYALGALMREHVRQEPIDTGPPPVVMPAVLEDIKPDWGQELRQLRFVPRNDDDTIEGLEKLV